MSPYEPRTIAFAAELVHAPVPVETQKVQTVHGELFQNSEVSYQNFQVAQDGIHLSNPGAQPNQVSVATVRPDRIIFREEFRPATVEDFATRSVNVSQHLYESLNVPASLVRVYSLRSLVNPQNFEDSRQLVGTRMLDAEAIASFGRPVGTAGVRFVFPGSTPTEPSYQLRIEPWTQEPRSLWIEVTAQCNRPIPAGELQGIGEELYAAYRFLSGPTLDFVKRFDQP
ncbi:MAG: hypothetical protein AAF196_12875 [Planctomycetota bacterium]